MKTVQHLFADLTAAPADLHGLAVEGQHPHRTADIQEVIAASVRRQMCLAHRITLDIGLSLL